MILVTGGLRLLDLSYRAVSGSVRNGMDMVYTLVNLV
jgi:hypothetical protein